MFWAQRRRHCIASEVEAYFEILVLLHLHRHTHTVEYSAIRVCLFIWSAEDNYTRIGNDYQVQIPQLQSMQFGKRLIRLYFIIELTCTVLVFLCSFVSCAAYVNSLPFLCRLVSLRRRYAPVDAKRPHFRRFEYAFGLVRWPTPIYTVHYNMYNCEFIKIFFFSFTQWISIWR